VKLLFSRLRRTVTRQSRAARKTANYSYMEHWDEKLNKIRYAREKSAALCYGVSMYRPSKSPSVITSRRRAE
jgi:hypothetical protein